MATKCTECGSYFSIQEALWDQTTIEPPQTCPQCDGRLEKRETRNYRKSLTYSLLGGGVVTPALFMIFNYFSNGEILFLFYGSLILLSTIATLAINARDLSTPPKRKGNK